MADMMMTLAQEERDKAMKDLASWKHSSSTLGPRIAPSEIERGPTPAVRHGGTIAVHFTPRQFATAARESTAQQEEEWLTKMATARRIKLPANGDESTNDRNPEFLKDKGVTFFKAGNYEAAINVFSEAISLNQNLPSLYSNRAACYLSLGNNESCVKDCCVALDLLFPVVPDNYTTRSKVLVRRGTAYAKMGELELALQDYNGAMKLCPENTDLQEDYQRIKHALIHTHSLTQ